jgi:hypothetical protein
MRQFLYTYEAEDGKKHYRFYETGKQPVQIRVKGQPAVLRELRSKASRRGGKWPMWSEAAGCLPRQVPEMRSFLASRGLSVDFNAEGDMKLESRGHRKRVLQALGIFDRNGGYGDPQPK